MGFFEAAKVTLLYFRELDGNKISISLKEMDTAGGQDQLTIDAKTCRYRVNVQDKERGPVILEPIWGSPNIDGLKKHLERMGLALEK